MKSQAKSHTALRFAVQRVSRLKPGESVEISRHILQDIGTSTLVGCLGPVWSPVDRIMENVVGSTWSIETELKPYSGSVVFRRRHEESDVPLYISPDRRNP